MTAKPPANPVDTFLTHAWSSVMRLVVSDPRILEPAALDFGRLLKQVDVAASRFRPDSELSVANSRAGRPTPVSRLLTELVDVALAEARDTDGLVDPTLGRALQELGYDRDIDAIRGREIEAGDEALVCSRTWRDVRLDVATGVLTVPAGIALDLGATAKAHIADRAARDLAHRYDCAVLVELGGDIAVAGVRPAGWVIDVAEHGGGAGQRVHILDGGLATSTTTLRRWRRDGRLAHHILDPRTGQCTEGPWRTASVYAATARQANTASTAAIVLGENALTWLEDRRFAARLVDLDGEVFSTAGWPCAVLAMAS